jgi:50S ribosomal protein L16 3-hydroxylase
LAEYWAKRCFASHEPAERLPADLRELCQLQLPQLLALAEGPVLVMYATRAGAYRSSEVAPAQALGFYQAGMTLYFHLDKRRPEIHRWLQALAADLRQPVDALRFSVFATDRGGITQCHFDINHNFTLQVRGRKRWKIAENHFAIRPLERFTVSDRVPEILRLHTVEEPPRCLPPDAQSIELFPGSMVYVPRGDWHEVEALEESLSFNFSFSPVTWLSLVLPAIRHCLAAHEEWREEATGAWGGLAERAEARRRLAALIARLPQDLTSLAAEDLLPASRHAVDRGPFEGDARFRRNQMATFGIERTKGSAEPHTVVVITVPGGPSAGLRLSPPALAACRVILQKTGPFSIGELAATVPSLEPAALSQLLAQLVEIGFVQRIEADRPG